MSAVTKKPFAYIDENSTLSNASSISTQLTSVQVLEVFGLIVIIVASVILNGLVCSVVCKTKSLRKLTTSIFIVNLSISNALVALFVIPFSVEAVIENAWKHSNIFCQVNGLSSMTFCISSIATLCCISIDRYYAVVRPMRYKNKLTRNRAICMLLIGWFLAILLSAAPLFGWAEYTYSPGTNHCSPNWKKNCGYHVFMACTVFAIPALILIFAYGRIFVSVRRHERRVSHWNASQLQGARSSCPCSFRESKTELGTAIRSSSTLQVNSKRPHLTAQLSRTSSLPQMKNNLMQLNELEINLDSKIGRKGLFLSTSDVRENTTPLEFSPLKSSPARPRSLTLSPKVSPTMRARSNLSRSSLPTRNFVLRIRTLTQISKRFQNNLISVRSKEYKIAKTGLLLVFIFFLSWGPYMMSNNCTENFKPPLWLDRLSMWLVYIGCVVNPLVYAFSSRHIQEAFVSVILRNRLKRWKTNIRVQLTRSRESVRSRQTLVNSVEAILL